MFKIAISAEAEEGDIHIGLFWIKPDNELLVERAPIKSVSDDNGIKIFKRTHRDVWEDFKIKYPELGYTDLPRGRVSFYTNSKIFMVYISSNFVGNSFIKSAVIKEFNFPENNSNMVIFKAQVDYDVYE